MSQSSGSTGRGDVTWPDAIHPPDVQGRDLDSRVGAGPPDRAPGLPPPGGPYVAGWSHSPAASRPRRAPGSRAQGSRVALAAVAVLSLALGAGIAFAVTRGSGGSRAAAANTGSVPPAGSMPSAMPSAVPSAVPSAAPSALAPSSAPSIVVPSQGSAGQSPGGAGALPGGAGALPGGAGALPGGSGSGTSGQAGNLLFLGTVSALGTHSVTLTAGGHTVTAGLTPATRIAGRLKVGDTVSAQLAKAAGGKYVVSEIQDPPGLP